METLPSMIAVRDQVVELPTVEEKIKYCAKLIYDTHNFLRTNNTVIPREARVRAMSVMRFAEKQLFQLIKK